MFNSRARHHRGAEPGYGSPPESRMQRRLKERHIAQETIPSQAATLTGQISQQVLAIAVLIHNMVINPFTRQPWTPDQSVEDGARTAFAEGLAMCQEEAVTISLPGDEASLQRANDAECDVDLAGHSIEQTMQILDDNVDYPPGSQCRARQAINEHQADRNLSLERERDGDVRHQQRAIERGWTVIAALVLSGLEVLLLWKPVLGLSAVAFADDLVKWCLALGFAAAQTLAIDFTVHRFREREREATDRHDAVNDFNRIVRQGPHREDLAAAAQSPPDLDKVREADAALTRAHQLLGLVAGGVGLVAIIRVAFLVREIGRSILEATVFAAFVGLLLGALVYLLGLIACRGNRLGDRLRAGAEVVADIDNRILEGTNRVAHARDSARLNLIAAAEARTWAEETREWVVDQYRQALLLAARLLGLPQPPVALSELVVSRELKVADATSKKIDEANNKLIKVNQWLAAPKLEPAIEQEHAGKEVALASENRGPQPVRVIPAPTSGELGQIVPASLTIGPRPTAPRWLLPAAASGCIVVAFVAALIAPTPEGINQSIHESINMVSTML